jgi:hypothetical protein
MANMWTSLSFWQHKESNHLHHFCRSSEKSGSGSKQARGIIAAHRARNPGGQGSDGREILVAGSRKLQGACLPARVVRGAAFRAGRGAGSSWLVRRRVQRAGGAARGDGPRQSGELVVGAGDERDVVRVLKGAHSCQERARGKASCWSGGRPLQRAHSCQRSARCQALGATHPAGQGSGILLVVGRRVQQSEGEGNDLFGRGLVS